MRNFLLASTIGAFALAAACSISPASAKDIKIGVVNLSLCCSYFVGMDAAVNDEAKQFPNIKVLSTDAKGDVAKLTSNVEDLLSQKVDGLIVSGAWIEAAPEALDAIKAAGVPVVMVDRLLKGGDYTSWVGPDNQQSVSALVNILPIDLVAKAQSSSFAADQPIIRLVLTAPMACCPP